MAQQQRAWNDHAGEIIYNSIDVLQKFAAMLKNDIAAIAEKERSLGFLNEQISDSLFELNKDQFPKAKEVINAFIASLSNVEYARKVMYQRDHQIAHDVFASSLELAKSCKELLRSRENAIKKYTMVKQAEARATKSENIAVATTNFQSLNTQAIQASATYANQVHRDLIIVLSSFAHSQMELYARTLETWSKFIEQIDEMVFDEDIESIATSLKESTEVYINKPQSE